MKIKNLLFASVVVCCFLTCASAFAQGTAFTYQGQLTVSNSPTHGTWNMTFKLWNAASGGAQVGSTITSNGVVIVTNGLFTVYLDFGNEYATGTPYWLELGVETNGGGSFTTLAPRQQLTPTPYSIFAEGANATGLTGTIPAGDLSGTYSNPLDLNNAGNIFYGNGANLTGVNAAELGGLTAANFWQLTGNAGTTPGVNYVGTPDNEALEIKVNGVRGFLIQPDPVYSTPNVLGGPDAYVAPGSVGNFIGAGGQGGYATNAILAGGNINVIAGGWGNTISNAYEGFIGGGAYNTVGNTYGVVSGGYNNSANGTASTVSGGFNNLATGNYSFAAGYEAQANSAGSFVWADTSGGIFTDHAPNQFMIRAAGGVGIGTVNGPEQFLSVHGGLNIDQANLNAGFVNNGNTNGYGLTFGSNSGEGIASERVAGANQYGLDFYTAFNDRMSISQSGTVQFNNSLYLLSPTSGLKHTNSVAGTSFGDGPFLWGYDGGCLGTVDTDGVNLIWDYSGNVWISNNCSVASLTIRGGADLAEPFNITSVSGEVPQGAVVVIDEQNPGHLKLSDQAYDTHVAGVVSGAKGINPGIQMQQQGILEGGKNVALTGRVYVQADASNGAIHPGDLLTTSSTPGDAMKVTDHARAAGAILGKAMTGLSEGKGMVLVLVTLQ